MPLARIDTKLIYFAHVPRCAGSSIEDYLQHRFGTLGFLDRQFLKVPRDQRWSNSSPQHIDSATFGRLLPTGFIEASFAVVRHPALRLKSVFLFQRDIEQTIPEGTGFSDWLHRLPELRRNTPFLFDNHIRPMSDLVPADSHIFKLEQGLEPLEQWLDQLADSSCPDHKIGHSNSHAARVEASQKPPRGPLAELTEDDLRQVAELDPVDYERFGYTVACPPACPRAADQDPACETDQS